MSEEMTYKEFFRKKGLEMKATSSKENAGRKSYDISKKYLVDYISKRLKEEPVNTKKRLITRNEISKIIALFEEGQIEAMLLGNRTIYSTNGSFRVKTRKERSSVALVKEYLPVVPEREEFYFEGGANIKRVNSTLKKMAYKKYYGEDYEKTVSRFKKTEKIKF